MNVFATIWDKFLVPSGSSTGLSKSSEALSPQRQLRCDTSESASLASGFNQLSFLNFMKVFGSKASHVPKSLGIVIVKPTSTTVPKLSHAEEALLPSKPRASAPQASCFSSKRNSTRPPQPQFTQNLEKRSTVREVRAPKTGLSLLPYRARAQEAGPQEVCIRVEAVSLNFFDVIHSMKAMPQKVAGRRLLYDPSSQQGVGGDFAGVVTAVGAAVLPATAQPGDEVFGVSQGALANHILGPMPLSALKPTGLLPLLQCLPLGPHSFSTGKTC